MMTKDKLNRLQIVKDKCISLINNTDKLELTYKRLRINNISDQIKLQEVKVGYRLVNKLLPNKN